ncbi:MAG: hypothetical protein HLUCCO16_20910 [Phormidium sp. OSCR]|nr:MAG: hypothetical protein HLUCCO16_20910 [Phormidium sp. OSCR]
MARGKRQEAGQLFVVARLLRLLSVNGDLGWGLAWIGVNARVIVQIGRGRQKFPRVHLD